MPPQYRPVTSRSPELHHPVPTHPPYEIPEPPGTPVFAATQPGAQPNSGYMRYTSPPPPQQQPYGGHATPYGRAPTASSSYGVPPPPMQPISTGLGGYQSFAGANQVPLQGQMGVPLSPNSRIPQQPQQPSVLVPGLASAWGVDNATAQIGVQFGRSAVAAGQDYVEKHIANHVPITILKHQFNVSNEYVLQKLRLVIFPWRHRPWTRQFRVSEQTGQAEGWKPPREDINSPDLYIPAMAVVTYILLAALHAGLQKRFNPEMLGVTSSKALGVILLDFFVIWFGCYILGISGQGQFVDIFAYSGYKFEGMVILTLSRLMGLTGILNFVFFVYVWFANGFFMVRSLRYIVFPDPTSSVAVANTHTPSQSQRSARRNFLFLVALSQAFYMWFLSVS